MFSWNRMIEYFPKIIEKFPVTLTIVVVSFLVGIILGSIQAAIRIKKLIVLNQLSIIFISYIRCTPVICQLFVIYFGIPALLKMLEIDTDNLPNMYYVLIAYGLNMGGFISEIIRSSILAVPPGQQEAGRSVGLRDYQTLFHIVGPQAFRIALPMLGTTFISLFQATALAYMIGVIDMIGKAKSLGNLYGHILEGYICCAIVFAIISLFLEHAFNIVNRKLEFMRNG
ncbi:MAG: amino acid ABC transporter permease [Lachnospiraceae bacterium]